MILPENRILDKSFFRECLVDKKTIKEIRLLYPKREDGTYLTNKFISYLFDYHNLDIKTYLKDYFSFDWPKCPYTNNYLGYKVRGFGIKINEFYPGKVFKENCFNFRVGCEKLKEERLGEKNPMFGKIPWNKGETKQTNFLLKGVSDKRLGIKFSEETRLKQSSSAKKRLIHGHSGRKHSKENVEKLRINTAKLWSSGVFSRKTSIEEKVENFLNSLGLEEPFEFQYFLKYFSMDFAFPKAKVAIECNGTYFHVDPRVYPDGPINAMQRKNLGRDKFKRKICCYELGWVIIPIWEIEINNDSFKENLLCELVKYNLLKNWENKEL